MTPVAPPSAFARRRGGILFKLLLALAGLAVVAVIAWVALLPGIVVSTVHSKTGFGVKVDQLGVNPFTGSVKLKGLVVQNPDGWPEAGFIDLREFSADVHLWPLMGGRFVADEVTLDLAQLTVVTNRDGVLNTTAFSRGFSGPQTGTPAGGSSPASGGGGRGFLIHKLRLKFGKLVYADYSRSRPVVKAYNVQLDRELTEVDSVAKIASPLTGNALGALAAALGGASPRDASTLNDAVDFLQSAGKKTGESLKNLFRSLDNKKP